MTTALKSYCVEMAETAVANARFKYAAHPSPEAESELHLAKLHLQSIKYPKRIELARVAFDRAARAYKATYSEEARLRLMHATDRLRKAERGEL